MCLFFFFQEEEGRRGLVGWCGRGDGDKRQVVVVVEVVVVVVVVVHRPAGAKVCETILQLHCKFQALAAQLMLLF